MRCTYCNKHHHPHRCPHVRRAASVRRIDRPDVPAVEMIGRVGNVVPRPEAQASTPPPNEA